MKYLGLSHKKRGRPSLGFGALFYPQLHEKLRILSTEGQKRGVASYDFKESF